MFLAHIYSRILAFWLMLSVVKTTLNKVYLILSYLILGAEIYRKVRSCGTKTI